MAAPGRRRRPSPSRPRGPFLNACQAAAGEAGAGARELPEALKLRSPLPQAGWGGLDCRLTDARAEGAPNASAEPPGNGDKDNRRPLAPAAGSPRI